MSDGLQGFLVRDELIVLQARIERQQQQLAEAHAGLRALRAALNVVTAERDLALAEVRLRRQRPPLREPTEVEELTRGQGDPDRGPEVEA